MPTIWNIGPLMIAADRALALLAIAAFMGLGSILASRTERPARSAVWLATLFGLLAARIGFIAQNWAAFSIEPWAMLAVWQGGFAPWIGFAAAAGVLIWYLGRQPVTALLLAALIALAAAHSAIVAALSPAPWQFPRHVVATTLAGDPVALDTLRGRPFVLNLWATWCPPCRRETPMIVDVARHSTVPVLLVNQGEDAARVRQVLARQGLSGDAVVLDPHGHVAAASGTRAYPTTLFVDASGKVVRVHVGEVSRAALTAAIRDLGSGVSHISN